MSQSTPEPPVQLIRQLSPQSRDGLLEAFTDLHDIAVEAERTLAAAIDRYGCNRVARTLGVSHQTAIRWAAGKLSRMPESTLRSLQAATEQQP